jgi:predicted DNA binding CopG/RHH family protein
MKQKDKQQTDAYLDMLKDAKEVSNTINQTMKEETHENRISNTDTMISIRLTNIELIQLKQLAKSSGMSVSKLLLNRTLNLNEATNG